MVGVLQDGVGSPEAVRAMKVLQCGQRAANDLLSHFGDPLEFFPVCHCAAGEPRTEAVSEDALHGGAGKRQAVSG